MDGPNLGLLDEASVERVSIASPTTGPLPPLKHQVPLLRRPLFWVALLTVALIALVFWRAAATRPSLKVELPVLSTVPAFAFVDESGRPFTSEALTGKVWVANFIFTRCPTICPLFTKKMAEVQKEALPLAAAMKLVSFTVDPAFDKPAVLAEYARKHKAQPGLWHFLTGTHDELKKTIVTDLKIHMSDQSDDIMAIAHGGHFVLVDRRMKIRGYYDSEDEDAVTRLVADMKKVVQESSE